MVSNNLVGLCFSVVLMAVSWKEILASLNVELISEIVILGLSGALGQIFIYLTINRFDCFILSTMTTSRKFFSIFFSIIMYGHSVKPLQWVGIVVVFSGIIFDIVSSELRKRKKSKTD